VADDQRQQSDDGGQQSEDGGRTYHPEGSVLTIALAALVRSA
jgi:hypothetical protein